MFSPTKQQAKLLDAATAIQLEPDNVEAAFIARQLVQATLPHKDPGDIPVWIRRNGHLTLKIQPSYDNNGVSTGLPYGTIPRLLLFWITTETLRSQSRRLELGNSLSEFMRSLGLIPTGGRWGTIPRLKKQMERLFQARISFDHSDQQRKKWLNMEVAPKGELWWDYRKPDEPVLFNSWIMLGEEFYNAITAAPVPVDVRALRALKRSPLALDLYAWATYTAYQTQRSGQVRSVSWELLHEQFGSDYSETRNFQSKAWEALRKIQTVYPDLGIERERGGVRVLPCNPAITIKTSKRQKAAE